MFVGVTGLVNTDANNARDIDVDLWAMTNQETGEYGVSQAFTLHLLCVRRLFRIVSNVKDFAVKVL